MYLLEAVGPMGVGRGVGDGGWYGRADRIGGGLRCDWCTAAIFSLTMHMLRGEVWWRRHSLYINVDTPYSMSLQSLPEAVLYVLQAINEPIQESFFVPQILKSFFYSVLLLIYILGVFLVDRVQCVFRCVQCFSFTLYGTTRYCSDERKQICKPKNWHILYESDHIHCHV